MGFMDCTTESTTLEQFQIQLNVNLTAVWAMTKYLIPAIKAAASIIQIDMKTIGASVIHIGSIAAFGAFVRLTPYCVAKAGVAHLTRLQVRDWVRFQFAKIIRLVSQAMEFAPHKVRVNCIQPATVITSWHEKAGMGKEKAARSPGVFRTDAPFKTISHL